MFKSILKIFIAVCLLVATPISMDKVERAYFKKFIGSFVVPSEYIIKAIEGIK